MATAKSLFDQTEPVEAQAVNALVLLRLTLRNFKGIKEFTLETGGSNVSIHGDNATGKTTVFDAFDWLLFDKDSQNRKDFQIKTLDENNQPAHRLLHEVEGVFSWKGRTLTLKKVYTEKWARPRGEAEEKLDSHTAAYFVDGISKPEKDYKAFVSQIASEATFRLLSDPAYFNEVLKWEERRKILIQVCGDVSDDEVITTDSDLAGIKSILGNHSLDDHRKFLKDERTRIDKELKQLPVRISEAQISLSDTSGVDPASLPKVIEQAKADRKAKFEELTRAEQGGGVSVKQIRLVEVGAQLSQMELEAQSKTYALVAAKRNDLSALQEKASATDRRIADLNAEAQRKDREVADLAAKTNTLREMYRGVRTQEFTADNTCPTCGQQIPEEKLQEARDGFNVRKADDLERINTEGKALKTQQETAQAEADKGRKESTAPMGALAKHRKDIRTLDTEIAKLQSQRGSVSTTQEYIALASERDRLTDEIADLRSGGEASLAPLRKELSDLETNVSDLERMTLLLEQRKTGEKRIEELRSQEKRLATEFEGVQRNLDLTDRFVRAKVRLLTDRINSLFLHARFKLFDEQMNGQLSECCETLGDGVPYGTNLNRGARMNIGLDIIRTLSKRYGFAAPVWIDNAEAVTSLAPMETQVIRLVVSEADKSLRIVKEVR